jgi:hypothetical protein
VTAVVLSISWATSASSLSSASGDSAAHSPAALAVRAVTTQTAGTAAAAAVPADFEAVMGYRPQVRDGLLVDPEGSCSSPIPLPAGFTPACAEHDLGYDLLRYAALTGHPLDPWARTAVDDRLSQRMRAVCAATHPWLRRAVCSAAAHVTATTVEVNSVRQFRGVPEESPGSWAVTGLAAGAMVVAAVGLVETRRRRRGRRVPHPPQLAREVPA